MGFIFTRSTASAGPFLSRLIGVAKRKNRKQMLFPFFSADGRIPLGAHAVQDAHHVSALGLQRGDAHHSLNAVCSECLLPTKGTLGSL